MTNDNSNDNSDNGTVKRGTNYFDLMVGITRKHAANILQNDSMLGINLEAPIYYCPGCDADLDIDNIYCEACSDRIRREDSKDEAFYNSIHEGR